MKKLHLDILKILKDDSRTTAARIAVMLGKAEAEIAAAIAAMEENGTLLKYTTVIDEEMLGQDNVQALIEVRVSPMYSHGFDAIAGDLTAFDEVKSLYLMSGGYDLAVFIEGKSLREVAMFVSEKLSVMDKVLSTATHFILKKYKVEGVACCRGSSDKRLVIQP